MRCAAMLFAHRRNVFQPEASWERTSSGDAGLLGSEMDEVNFDDFDEKMRVFETPFTSQN
jgi:hypothetical protein